MTAKLAKHVARAIAIVILVGELSGTIALSTKAPVKREAIKLSSVTQRREVRYLCFNGFLQDVELLREWARWCQQSSLQPSDPSVQEAGERVFEQLDALPTVIRGPFPQRFFFAVIHNLERPEFGLILRINELQVPFVLNGQIGRVHTPFIPKDEMFIGWFEVSTPPQGLSNASLVLFEWAGEVSRLLAKDEEDIRVNISIVGRSLYLGQGEPPLVSEHRPPDSAFRSGAKPPGGPTVPDPPQLYVTLEKTPSEEDFKRGWSVTVSPGDPIPVYLHLRALCLDDSLHDYAISLFLEGIQLPLAPEIEGKVGHYRLRCDEEVHLSVTLQAPSEPGRYRLTASATMNPYHLMRRSTWEERIWSPLSLNVLDQPRYLVNVVPSE